MGAIDKIKKAKNRLVGLQPFGVDLCGKPITGMRFCIMKSADADDKGILLKSESAPPAGGSAESGSAVIVSDERLVAVGESLAFLSDVEKPLTDEAKGELRYLLQQAAEALGDPPSDGQGVEPLTEGKKKIPATEETPPETSALPPEPAASEKPPASVVDAPPAETIPPLSTEGAPPVIAEKPPADISTAEEDDALDGVDLESDEVKEFLGRRIEHHVSGDLQLR